MLRETDFPQFINLKCLRLNPPNLNKLITPLNGLYNDINNKEDINVFPLEKKTSNFSLSSNNLNIENVFIINEKFGKVYFSEIFEAILIFINTSNYYEIELKNIEIVIAIEVKKKLLRVRFQSDIPQNIIYIKPLESYGIKIRFKIETNYKYLIDTYAICQSKYYDEIISKDENKFYRIFNKTDKYQISNGRVELNFVRRFTFDSLIPFQTKEKFLSQLKNCIIEQKIKNISTNPLVIQYIKMNCKLKPDEIFEIPNEDKIKYHIIEPNNELIVIYLIKNSDIFSNENSFILDISWTYLFDLKPKNFYKEIQNGFDLCNNFISLNVVEQPRNEIIENQNFKIIFSLSKKTKQNILVIIETEALRDCQKSNDREIEIIDIIEKKMELNSKTPSNNFILICKSDILGRVYLPRLKFLLYEDNNNNPTGNVFDALISFNCIQQNDNS
jgi:hypothetical protein